ncbi:MULTISPECIES: hypothetical protein [Brucella]|uniref:Uncharacterized protein n=10 Tax=Brucella TaxID=234 RepID=Q2YJ88_BRUA2|nr:MULTISPECIES: hypothetical protein [Brucella]AAN33265.1 hypothetical protein BRA0053 [Brucella suis 1330]AAX75504.1 hypothetical protein BruAb2_0053 [Brucella abortus bv. 1 str. 9-941]ABX63258.1 Hypothetical protein, conserved [Brucella canis ATCC 23365]ABY39084.1 Hypothetical protein, conserved [Brucella suis ATCC 23445]ACO01938.1 Hypothetical protein, conserved [Brucella melitensis ATCC 23457]ACU49196.1 hypothetical protein BMI_II55 [Brucella microti CCM 4915]AEU07215.1 hypothetical pro
MKSLIDKALDEVPQGRKAAGERCLAPILIRLLTDSTLRTATGARNSPCHSRSACHRQASGLPVRRLSLKLYEQRLIAFGSHQRLIGQHCCPNYV